MDARRPHHHARSTQPRGQCCWLLREWKEGEREGEHAAQYTHSTHTHTRPFSSWWRHRSDKSRTPPPAAPRPRARAARKRHCRAPRPAPRCFLAEVRRVATFEGESLGARSTRRCGCGATCVYAAPRSHPNTQGAAHFRNLVDTLPHHRESFVIFTNISSSYWILRKFSREAWESIITKRSTTPCDI